ncbi:hypothetical protein O7598_20120 [Micromonospora sp. WMMC241]|uniref:hypothetical protein n=1 Tax=Micromonospora sp. WMMC241 TaxID=3015159 RepID=UPI0022B659F3|nr:hypothetical protein [Micromonospora sp. WMMC241]MCZ7438729.1 hypothetical protein [Micromonospora sp. WMMC241]
MPDAVNVFLAWSCIAFGVLLAARSMRLLRADRRRGRQTRRPEPLTAREVLWEGGAFVLIGTANLLDGRWTLLVLPAVAVMLVLCVRVAARLIRQRSRRAE